MIVLRFFESTNDVIPVVERANTLNVDRDPIKFCVNDKHRQYEKLRLGQEWE